MIAILGAGPHGRQIADLINVNGGGPAVLFDDNLPGYLPVEEGAQTGRYLIGAMWPAVRRSIAQRVPGIEDGRLEGGSFIFPGAWIGIETAFGEHVHVGYNAVIQHGCTIGDFVTVCAGAVLCGEVSVEDDVFIGANVTVIHGGITIGRGAVIGAGTVITNDVPAGTTVFTNRSLTVRP